MLGDPAQPLSWFGLPIDAWGWGAGLLGVVLLMPGATRPFQRAVRSPLLLPLLALLSALLSAAYFQERLGGQPRIIDASTYLLEARTFAAGHFTFEVPEATALFRGRFLLSPPGDPTHLGPIFPPGYPALLSLAVRLGHFALLGPLLAALITVATAWLGYLVTQRRQVALLAALFSVLSAALRYHTADTMSHGLSILLSVTSLCATLDLTTARPRAGPRAWMSALLGLSLGGLAATRPLTAVAVGLSCALPLLGARRPLHPMSFALGLAPGLLLLGSHHRALTGSWFGSPQLAYYALADGPPGCFRLGLGAGCHVEHADVVQAQGGQGLTLAWMLRNTVHRLHWHALDVANCELLLPLCWYWLARKWPSPRVRPLALLSLLLPACYALFYFQGSYPGGGARFLSELLPALHVALAAGLLALGWAPLGVAASLLGYAVHAALVHQALPGAPPLTTTQGPDATPTVATDHAFNVLFDPARMKTGAPPTVVRRTHDDRRWSPVGPPVAATLEAEADWPLLVQAGVWSERAFVDDACVSGRRALRLHRAPGSRGAPAEVQVELTGVPVGTYSVTAWFWSASRGCTVAALGDLSLPRRHQLDLADFFDPEPGSPLHLDRFELVPAP